MSPPLPFSQRPQTFSYSDRRRSGELFGVRFRAGDSRHATGRAERDRERRSRVDTSPGALEFVRKDRLSALPSRLDDDRH